MKRITAVLFILLSLSLVVAATSYNKGYVSNKQKLKITSNSSALIGVTTDRPISREDVDDDESGDDDSQEMRVAAPDAKACVAPSNPQATGTVRITNRSANDIVVTGLRCTRGGYDIDLDYDSHIPSGSSILVGITIDGGLPDAQCLPFKLNVEWVDGNAEINFTVPVVEG